MVNKYFSHYRATKERRLKCRLIIILLHVSREKRMFSHDRHHMDKLGATEPISNHLCLIVVTYDLRERHVNNISLLSPAIHVTHWKCEGALSMEDTLSII